MGIAAAFAALENAGRARKAGTVSGDGFGPHPFGSAAHAAARGLIEAAAVVAASRATMVEVAEAQRMVMYNVLRIPDSRSKRLLK